jgi:predicted ATP-dependent endonuclease of OLD family
LKSIKLALSAYGPFDELELNITPITILAGPNIIGKSFLMRAIYAMLAPCDQGALDVGDIVSRLCNDTTCSEPACLDRVLKRGLQVLDVRLSAWGYKRSLKYNSATGSVELLEADCPPVEAVIVPGTRAYLVSHTYLPVERPFPGQEELIKELFKKYTDAVKERFIGLIESAPETVKDELRKLVDDSLKIIEEVKDLKTYVKTFTKIARMLGRLAFILSKHGIEAYDIEKDRVKIIEQLNAIVSLYLSSLVSDMVTLLEPVLSRLMPELEVGKIHKVKLEELTKEIINIVKSVFPETEYLNISLPGISEAPSDIPLLPSSILHSYPLIISLVYAEKLIEAGGKVVLLIEEPELGLDIKRQRVLAGHIVSAIKKAKGALTVVLSTHSVEMIASLAKEIARRKLRKYSRVCEVYDGKVKCRTIDRAGRVYVKYMFKELGEIYGDLV